MLAQRRRDIRQYLRKPNELFRRVRDEHGQLHLSKRAAAYHPGQGVYRSSYKNARRLTATETNMAYETSDYKRWQQLDFVVGIEVRLSGNHTCLGGDGKPHKFTDICDELAGKYPKTFKFTGWHPQCRCIAISILKTQEEMDADTQKILNGEPIDGESVNKVDDVPQAFKDWCAANADRIDRAAERGTLPYFLRDNRGYMDKALSQPKQPTILERAAARHAARTPEQAKAIQQQWQERGVVRRYGNRMLNVMGGISDVDTGALEKALQSGDLDKIRRETKKLRDIGKEIQSYNKLDNPLQVARETSMATAKQINDNVVRTLRKMPLDLEGRKDKLEFEISWMGSEGKSRYPQTYKYAQAAYKKELAGVEYILDVEKISDSVKPAIAFAATSRSKIIKSLADEMKALLAKKTDVAVLQAKADELMKKYEKLKPKAIIVNGVLAPQPISHETLDEVSRRLGGKLPKTLSALNQKINQKNGVIAGYWNAAEIKNAKKIIKEVLDNGCYGMNVPRVDSAGNDDVIDKIFTSWFKNQIETKTGNGCVDVKVRRQASLDLFGTPVKTDAVDYEKYGFLMDRDIVRQSKSGIADHYWNYGDGLQIRFRKDKVLATFTMQDSLGSGLVPSLCSDPQITSFGRYNKPKGGANTLSAIDSTQQYAYSYIELQYHGKLTLDCIESVFIKPETIPKLRSGTLDLIRKSGATIYSVDSNGKLIQI